MFFFLKKKVLLNLASAWNFATELVKASENGYSRRSQLEQLLFYCCFGVTVVIDYSVPEDLKVWILCRSDLKLDGRVLDLRA